MSDCAVDGCDRPAQAGRSLCPGHRLRKLEGRDVNSPLAPRHKDKLETVSEAALACEASIDEDRTAREGSLLAVALRYARSSSSDDAEFKRNEKRLEQAAARYGLTSRSRKIRLGLEAARRAGVKLGPPCRLDLDIVTSNLLAERSFRAAARALGVHHTTLVRFVRRLVRKQGLRTT